jgi:hypothetical protein
MKTTREAMEETGLSTFRFRKIVEVLKISPLKKIRGEISFRWSPEDVRLITDYSKIYFKPKRVIDEEAIINYFYGEANNINQVANKFNLSYHIVDRIIMRYIRENCVIVESKMKEYDG